MKFSSKDGEKYKVTRSIPQLTVSETKLFRSKEKALKQLENWLH